MNSPVHSLKVAIDFGTTHSGVAWAHTETPDEIRLIQRWPAGGDRNREKVPTEIAYAVDGTHKWGCELSLETEKLLWIKLLLDPFNDASSRQSGHSPMARTKKLIPRSKTVVSVVADYLRSLKDHTLITLERDLGREFMERTQVDWILTVPAVWSEATKASTLEAASIAGLGTRHTIQLISEPDAAAVFALKYMQPNYLKINDTFVVVDCGGGTVDLISYQIVALHPKLEVKECAVGTGGMCGSTFINKNFEKFVQSRIGYKLDKMEPKGRNVMREYFEECLKRNFSDDEDEEIFSCPIPGVEDDLKVGIYAGLLPLTREEMREIFEPVIAEVVELVQQQINAVEAKAIDEDEWDECKGYYQGEVKKFDVSAIILVGGFGSSEYLRQRLISDLRVRRGAPIRIMQPTNGLSAVVRGAVLRGLEGGIVRSRLARRNYGVECRELFNPMLHHKSEIIRSQWTGEAEVPNCSLWFISKGDEVSKHNPISFPFRSHWGVDWTGDIVLNNYLLASDLDKAPMRTNTGDSFILCRLRSNLKNVPKHTLPIRSSFGSDYYEICYNLVVTVQSAMLLFEFEFQGKTYGTVNAKYE